MLQVHLTLSETKKIHQVISRIESIVDMQLVIFVACVLNVKLMLFIDIVHLVNICG